jgi:DNA-binding XRE family transcriptional regulator
MATGDGKTQRPTARFNASYLTVALPLPCRYQPLPAVAVATPLPKRPRRRRNLPSCQLPVANLYERKLMKYDEDLLVELITDAELTHTEIAEKVGISRRTVWSIANGHSRPDLQRKIADTAEGYRQAALRHAARHMKALLDKQITVALEGDGETSRKSREFLLKTFMTALSDQAAQTAEKRKAELAAEKERAGRTSRSGGGVFRDDLLIAQIEKFPTDLKDQVMVALGGPPNDVIFGDTRTQPPAEPEPEDPAEPAVADPACPVEDPVQEVQEEVEDELRTGRKMEDPFISGPRRMREASEAAIKSALEQGPIRRRVPRDQ